MLSENAAEHGVHRKVMKRCQQFIVNKYLTDILPTVSSNRYQMFVAGHMTES